ncbi:UNVERIFIED_CONTAM: hypothetical protein FKN15_047827 [Acipenser sinensis]
MLLNIILRAPHNSLLSTRTSNEFGIHIATLVDGDTRLLELLPFHQRLPGVQSGYPQLYMLEEEKD